VVDWNLRGVKLDSAASLALGDRVLAEAKTMPGVEFAAKTQNAAILELVEQEHHCARRGFRPAHREFQLQTA